MYNQYNIRYIFSLSGWVEDVLGDVVIFPTLGDVVGTFYLLPL